MMIMLEKRHYYVFQACASKKEDWMSAIQIKRKTIIAPELRKSDGNNP